MSKWLRGEHKASSIHVTPDHGEKGELGEIIAINFLEYTKHIDLANRRTNRIIKNKSTSHHFVANCRTSKAKRSLLKTHTGGSSKYWEKIQS